MLEYLQIHQVLFLISMGILGLIVGSFLNVVIYRLPIMLQTKWRMQCEEFLGTFSNTIPISNIFNLAFPRSHCPHCQQTLGIFENIPIISYIFLRGKCAKCSHDISMQYPMVETLSMCFTLFFAWYFGATIQGFSAIILAWGLICLSIIDIKHQLLPDEITLPLLWLGLLLNVFGIFTYPSNAIIGAIAGYLSLWSIYQLFKFVTLKEGFGYGDFKLLALLGAWLGWRLLPFIILFASILGTFVGLFLMLFKGFKRDTPIPFGPYLAVAGLVSLLWGPHIIRWYFGI